AAFLKPSSKEHACPMPSSTVSSTKFAAVCTLKNNAPATMSCQCSLPRSAGLLSKVAALSGFRDATQANALRRRSVSEDGSVALPCCKRDRNNLFESAVKGNVG